MMRRYKILNSNPSIVNVISNFVEERIDAGYYNSKHLENYARVINFGSNPLGNIADVTKLSGFEFTKHFTNNEHLSMEVPCIMSQNVQENNLDLTNTIFISRKTHFILKRSSLSHGEIILSYTGQYRRAAVVPSNKGLLHLGPNVCKITIQKNDPFFITSFLNSYYGQSILDKEKTISAQPTVNMARIRTVPIIKLEDFSQKYIGNKVRQADKLRGWAKRLKKNVDIDLGKIIPKYKKKNERYNRLKAYKLNNRLDPRPYRSHYLALNEALNSIKSDQIKNIAILSSGDPVSSKNFLTDGGVSLVRIRNIYSDNFCGLDIFVSEGYAATKPSTNAKEGRIVLGMDGIFRAQFFLEEELPMHINQRIAIIDTHSIRPELLTHWLNRPEGQMQLNQWAVKTTVEHTSLADISTIIIPRLSDKREDELANALLFARKSIKFSLCLTCVSKQLVEALIENKLTEQELINAQHALGKGDTTLDRQILSRLTTKGIDDESSPPLFPDLNQLYELLEKAEEPLEVSP